MNSGNAMMQQKVHRKKKTSQLSLTASLRVLCVGSFLSSSQGYGAME